MRKLFSILSFVILYITIAFGQAAVDIQISVTDNVGSSQVIYFGLDPAATDGIDPALGESDLPPPPPGNAFDARFWLPPFGGALSSIREYRNATFPFTGSREWQTKFQSTDYPITISWNLPPEILATSRIQDLFGGALINVPFTGTGNVVVTNAGIGQLRLLVDFSNIGPSGGPEFSIAPPSLNFGLVAVGGNSTLQATVTNTGTDPLDITNISSSDPQFTFLPGAPVTIGPGLNQVFNITFAPTALGLVNANIIFTHNGTGSPFNYPVSGTGASAGPTFAVNPTSLNFGNVGVGVPEDLTVTVSNNGLTNPLTISSAATAAPFTVSPLNAVIPAQGSQVFTVTFTPPSGGAFNGSLVFTHDAPGSPSSVPLSGNGVATFGIVFEEDTTYRLEDDFYMDRMQLISLDQKAQAIQFRLQVNKNTDDNVILTFQSIQKGTNVSDASWILDYNIFRGPITGNGASVDEIFVLLYNLNEDGGLNPGDYTDLLRVNYRVADLPALQDSVKSSFLITHAEGSTNEGFPIDIAPSRDELVVIAKNRVGGFGDVNGDGCLDILDLILVVDHIVGRDSLTGAQFERADIAPWVPGNALPDPDGFVNVQDLSLIQNIILTGLFPDGTEINDCGPGLPKSGVTADALVKFYINPEGITAVLTSTVAIRGAQIEFNNVTGNPENMVINTDLGQGYYSHIEEVLKTLLYDRLATKYIEAGEHFMADMPFMISNPEEITLRNLILVDTDRNKLGYIEVELIYGSTPLPLDYILFQNYPNPFNPNTSVKFQVPKTSNVTVTIYDMLGQEVRTLFASEVMRGTYSVEWDGMNDAGMQMSSGSYIYRMIAGDYVQSKKMVLLK